MDPSEIAPGRLAARAGPDRHVPEARPDRQVPEGTAAPGVMPMSSVRGLVGGSAGALAMPAMRATVLAGGNAAVGRLIQRAPTGDEPVGLPGEGQTVPAAGSALGRIRDLAYQGWVGPLDEAEIESLWAGLGDALPAVAGAEMPLWRHCLDVGAELDELPQIERLRGQFVGDVRDVAAGYLAGNRRLVADEMQRLGLPAQESGPLPDPDGAQADQVREMQLAASAVGKLQDAQERARRVFVGYEIEQEGSFDGSVPVSVWSPVTFDPYTPPQMDTAPDSDLLSRILMPGIRVPIVPYPQIKERYDAASDAISDLVTRFPALHGLSRQGSSAVTAGWAAADPRQARRQLAAALRVVDHDIVNAIAKLADGDLDPLDLQPIHEQLFAGRPGRSGVGWNGPLPGWSAREQVAGHNFSRALAALGMQAAATALFLVAPLTGGASLFVMLGGLAVTGTQFYLSQERYEALSEAAGTAVGPDTDMVSRPQVDAAELARNADREPAVAEPYDFTKTDAMRDPEAFPHILKIRQNALKTLAVDGTDQPVKVVPLRYNPATSVKGDFTKAKFVQGRTPEELARVLGVAEFKDGVRVYRLDRSALTVDNVNLRGYTQSPAGKSPLLQTPENLEKWPPGLGAPQWNATTDIPVTSAAEFHPGQPARF